MLVETKARTTDELNHINDYLCDLFSGRAAEFYLALHIMVQSQQLWLLNSGTLRFFYQLHERSIPIFDQLLNSLTTRL